MSKFGKLLEKDRVAMVYVSKLVRAMRKNFELAQEARRHELHASLLDSRDGKFCVRRALLRILEPSETVPSSRILHFEDGIWRHKRWQSLLEQAGLASPEDLEKTRMMPGLYTLCTPDHIIKIGGKRYIWECKGMNSREFRAMMKSGKCPRRFLDRVHIYGAAVGLNRAIIHIDNKDRTDEFKVFVVRLDQKRISTLLDRLIRLEQAYLNYLKTKTLPPRCGNENCLCASQ